MSQLEHLFTKYGTDKGIWGYTPAYEKYLGPTREKVTDVLEIGICGFRDIPNNVVGASLFAWRDYFPNATIYGIDNDARFIFNDQANIRTALADAYDEAQLAKAFSVMLTHPFSGFDFICDDAVHDPLPQVGLCNMLWPLLKTGGVYAIEEACPYKCVGNKLDGMVQIMMGLRPGMKVEEICTHKDERLLLLRKGE